MSSVKKILVAAALFVFCLSYSDNLVAMGDGGNSTGSEGSKFPNAGNNNGGGSVGAPIDGGLLTILAAAGAGYFVVRKKKNKKDQE